MASRGHLGGLSWSTPQALRVLDAAGFDVVLVETVGVGQAEVEIASLADSTLVLLAPGMGDAIQAAKAGILEVADVFVVNKADRDGARDHRARGRSDVGPDRPWDAIGRRRCSAPWPPPAWVSPRWWTQSRPIATRWNSPVALDVRRRRRIAAEIDAIALMLWRRRIVATLGDRALDALAAAVSMGHLDPEAAARRLIG